MLLNVLMYVMFADVLVLQLFGKFFSEILCNYKSECTVFNLFYLITSIFEVLSLKKTEISRVNERCMSLIILLSFREKER